MMHHRRFNSTPLFDAAEKQHLILAVEWSRSHIWGRTIRECMVQVKLKLAFFEIRVFSIFVSSLVVDRVKHLCRVCRVHTELTALSEIKKLSIYARK